MSSHVWESPKSPGTDTPSSRCSHQMPWPSSMIRWSARCSSLASASHSNHATDAASGHLSGRLIEELIPLPQKAFAVRGDYAPDSLDLSGSVPPVVAVTGCAVISEARDKSTVDGVRYRLGIYPPSDPPETASAGVFTFLEQR